MNLLNTYFGALTSTLLCLNVIWALWVHQLGVVDVHIVSCFKLGSRWSVVSYFPVPEFAPVFVDPLVKFSAGYNPPPDDSVLELLIEKEERAVVCPSLGQTVLCRILR